MNASPNSHQVGVAAEAFAAAVFAQAGYDVSVQYGANQPEYDLVISKNRYARKVSVKGSRDGGWVLVAGHKNPSRTYHEAIEHWRQKHSDPELLYCFVQLKGVPFGSMPRIYIATVDEVAAYLRKSCAGHGYTSLRECYKWARGKAAGTVDEIPAEWKVSPERIAALVGA